MTLTRTVRRHKLTNMTTSPPALGIKCVRQHLNDLEALLNSSYRQTLQLHEQCAEPKGQIQELRALRGHLLFGNLTQNYSTYDPGYSRGNKF